MPTVRHLFISPGHNYFGRHGLAAGEHDIVAVDAVECVAGRGLRGDRFFDYKPDYKGQVTLFSLEVFQGLLAEKGLPPTSPAAVRRNLFTEGVDLNALVGREFSIGPVRLLGVEECRPCAWMDEAVGPGAEAWLKGRGGLRCKILSDGVIRVGDEVDCGVNPADARTTSADGPAENLPKNAGMLSAPSSDSQSAIRNPQLSSPVGLVLAGGKSTRMGADKALLEKDGEPLVARQTRLLREAGCARVLVSGRPGVAYPVAGDTPVIFDRDGEGPAAGILAAFDAAPDASHLLVLATDMPDMSAAVLAGLLREATPDAGVAYATDSGVEPLAALYPKNFGALLRRRVLAGDLSPQAALREAVSAGIMRVIIAPPAAVAALFNRNAPGDMPPAPPG